MDSAISTFLDGVKFFDPGHTLAQVSMALFWMGGGAGAALSLCAFSTIIRATKGAAGDTSI
jgi:hypothetical protein